MTFVCADRPVGDGMGQYPDGGAEAYPPVRVTRPAAPVAASRSAFAGRSRIAFLARSRAAWLAPPCLAVLAGAGFITAPPGASGASDAAARACEAADWQATVALDGSRPETAMATLRSRNEVGRAGSRSCVEARFACSREGPYFEVRLSTPSAALRDVGPLQIRSLQDELSARVFPPNDGSESAVRIADKPAVELIAFALANSLAFRVPMTFANGEAAVADFKSYHFSTAVRPVLFACNMRLLQTDEEDGGETDDQ